MNPVRDDTATTTCGSCEQPYDRVGRQRFCSTTCRQAAWRQKRAAPIEPAVAKADTVYQCDDCDTRYLGEQRCDQCNRWCRRIGPGGTCPSCDEPVAMTDLFTDQQLQRQPTSSRRR